MKTIWTSQDSKRVDLLLMWASINHWSNDDDDQWDSSICSWWILMNWWILMRWSGAGEIHWCAGGGRVSSSAEWTQHCKESFLDSEPATTWLWSRDAAWCADRVQLHQRRLRGLIQTAAEVHSDSDTAYQHTRWLLGHDQTPTSHVRIDTCLSVCLCHVSLPRYRVSITVVTTHKSTAIDEQCNCTEACKSSY